MMPSQALGNRYLAALVIVAAALHCAAVLISSALVWDQRNAVSVAARAILLGIAPSLVASFLAGKALVERGGRSAAWSAGGLTVLLAAIVLSKIGWKAIQ